MVSAARREVNTETPFRQVLSALLKDALLPIVPPSQGQWVMESSFPLVLAAKIEFRVREHDRQPLAGSGRTGFRERRARLHQRALVGNGHLGAAGWRIGRSRRWPRQVSSLLRHACRCMWRMRPNPQAAKHRRSLFPDSRRIRARRCVGRCCVAKRGPTVRVGGGKPRVQQGSWI
jgi:hypothetical protein